MEWWQRYSQRNCLDACQRCLLSDPLCRLLLGALRSRGCHLTLTRHLACEPCETEAGRLRGGFDQATRQIVICSNAGMGLPDLCQTLRHELVHAFDACRAHADFEGSLDHLACTEVRAYNLAEPSPRERPAGGHRSWVRERAVASLLAVRRLERSEAEAAVDRVFERCYADLEPLGRRALPTDLLGAAHVASAQLAAREAKLYGYWGECDSAS